MIYLGTIALAYSFASLAWSRADIVVPALWLTSLALAFVLGKFLDHKKIYEWFVSATIICLVVGYFAGWAFGISFGPNVVASIVVTAIVLALAHEWYFHVLLLTPAFILTESRSAAGAMAICSLVWIWYKHRLFAVLLCFVCGTLFLAFSESKSEGTGLFVRLGIWQDTLNHMTAFGTGYGSFLYEYSSFAVKRNLFLNLAPHAYNEFLEITFELGLGAFPLWFFFAAGIARQGPEDRLLSLCVFMLSLTFFPLSIFPIAQLFFFSLAKQSPVATAARLGRWDWRGSRTRRSSPSSSLHGGLSTGA